MTKTFALEMDIAADCAIEELNAIADQYDVRFELIEEFGPAGGNPLYNIIGEYDNVSSIALEIFANHDIEEFDEIYKPYILEV